MFYLGISGILCKFCFCSPQNRYMRASSWYPGETGDRSSPRKPKGTRCVQSLAEKGLRRKRRYRYFRRNFNDGYYMKMIMILITSHKSYLYDIRIICLRENHPCNSNFNFFLEFFFFPFFIYKRPNSVLQVCCVLIQRATKSTIFTFNHI